MSGLAADIYCDVTGKKWTAEIWRGGKLIWRKTDMRTEYNAGTAMEVAWAEFKQEAARGQEPKP